MKDIEPLSTTTCNDGGESRMPASRTIVNHPQILKDSEIIRVSEVKDRLHGFVGRQAVEGWIRDGFDNEKLRTALIGRVRVTSVQELERFLFAINGKSSGITKVNTFGKKSTGEDE